MASTAQVQTRVRRNLQDETGSVEAHGDEPFVRHGSTGCRPTFHEVGRVTSAHLSTPILFRVPPTPVRHQEVARSAGEFRYVSICRRQEEGKGGPFGGATIGGMPDEDELRS